MNHPGFFNIAGPFTLAEIAAATQSEIKGDAAASARTLDGVQPLSEAAPHHLSFFDNRKYLPQLLGTKAGACLVSAPFVERVPVGTVALVAKAPYRAFAQALALFYPEAMRCKAAESGTDVRISPSAVIEDGVEIEPGAIVGPEARIGRGTRIAAGAVIGYRVAIGRDCYVGPLVSVLHALVGDRVILHAGVRIGQDGFGFAMGAQGHLKVPQVGRVIIQDDVEIGANSTVDRGALKDTIIGEGTKIDNLVQIGHNVVIGRHCVIVGQVGISGSTELGDYVVMGGQSGAVGHIKIGNGAQIAGGSHPKDDVPPGAVLAGTPARPFKQWAREVAAVSRLARRAGGSPDDSGGS
ncbi:UDP-3-O-(3-hydroxymyristoyl)glucosamine N-acyltransferase [Hyphomicrobium sp.]|uniref:UDP-3-O-(3-hydroxymyristoyl)glucosamine N-acyltransferase n=1 Tax=Hyphomicrobium sp. TaxID=82 RepID=UPI0025C13895|nr:UDP-3-O-(3-hydroxymyristoyl)glucosamine N-acyltransferase [Hyphomicrobium sp.]MCC7251855.1 UDP-3-O-(3-hydroxymyristoyl)glucosamine N-acyltransferase [Hyphomicrobium sp.]